MEKKPIFETFAGNILKVALIFGPNASGKSNLIKILQSLKSVLLTNRLINANLPSLRFLLSKDTVNEPTEISIGFISGNKYYFYELGFGEQVVYERLYLNDELYFNREVGKNGFSKISGLKSDINYEQILRSNSLLVYRLQDDNDREMADFYDWFENKLIILDDVPSFSNTYRFHENMNRQLELLKENSNRNVFVNFLRAADINISGVEVVERNGMSFSQVSNNNIVAESYETQYKELMLVHDVYNDEGIKVGEKSFSIDLESTGTQKLIYLLLNLIDYSQERVIVMDEFDDSFHIKLSTSLLSVFNSPLNQTQFIFTTHEALLMDSGLRRDQIYFVDKDVKGASSLFSLDDFEKESRNDVNNSKKYIEGRFGAVPIVFVEDMTNSLGELEKCHEKEKS
jgi:AAA15 family ATPase/GTPase